MDARKSTQRFKGMLDFRTGRVLKFCIKLYHFVTGYRAGIGNCQGRCDRITARIESGGWSEVEIGIIKGGVGQAVPEWVEDRTGVILVSALAFDNVVIADSRQGEVGGCPK